MPAISENGLAGPNISRKKKPVMTNSVTIAQPTSGSESRLRKWTTTSTTQTDRISAHSRIEPSRALHRAAKLNRRGVLDDPTLVT